MIFYLWQRLSWNTFIRTFISPVHIVIFLSILCYSFHYYLIFCILFVNAQNQCVSFSYSRFVLYLIQWLNYHSHWLFSCASLFSKLCLFAACNIFLKTHLFGWSLRLKSSSRSLLFFLRNQFIILFSFHPFILSTCFLLQSLFWFFTIATFSFMLRPFTFFFLFESSPFLVNFKQSLH